MSVLGYATKNGTETYKQRFSATLKDKHFREAEEFFVSSIGIGTYLGESNETVDRRYRKSIIRAIEIGCNIIDTASNYRYQRSEKIIASALEEIQEKGFHREEIVVCTKGGYIPTDRTSNIKTQIENTIIKKGLATFKDIINNSHCMTPNFLENQINQSLQNLNLSCLDIFYIHNPEVQKAAATPKEFEKRIAQAFERLEKIRNDKKIQYYGVATWQGFRVPVEHTSYHSLENFFKIALEVGGVQHGFKFLQLPMNFAMTEAYTEKNQKILENYYTVLEAADLLGVSVIASATILQGSLINNLTNEIREVLGLLQTDAQTCIQFVRSTPNIKTALVGMKEVTHVEENLELAKIESTNFQSYKLLF